MKIRNNGYAARKAFVMTRIGDTSMALGLFLLFTQLHTLDIQSLMLQGRKPMDARHLAADGLRRAAAGRRGG